MVRSSTKAITTGSSPAVNSLSASRDVRVFQKDAGCIRTGWIWMCWGWLLNLVGWPPNFSSPSSPRSGRMAPHKDYGVKKLPGDLYDFKSCKKGEEKVILLFIHGIALDEQKGAEEIPFRTWTFEETESKICWPSKLNDLFKEDEYMEKEKDEMVVRALTVVYDPCKINTHNTGRFDLFCLAENFNQTVIRELVTKGKKIPMILVAHSFGGFVIQALIDKAFKTMRSTDGYTPQRQFFENLGGIFFYSTPFKALLRSTYDHFFPEVDDDSTSGVTYSELVKLLKELNAELSRDTSSFAKNIAAICRDYRGGKPIKIRAAFEVNVTVMTNWTGMIVEEASARHVPGHEDPVSLPHDNFGVCKLPVTVTENKELDFEDTLTDSRYTALRDFIKDIVGNSNLSAGPSSAGSA